MLICGGGFHDDGSRTDHPLCTSLSALLPRMNAPTQTRQWILGPLSPKQEAIMLWWRLSWAGYVLKLVLQLAKVSRRYMSGTAAHGGDLIEVDHVLSRHAEKRLQC